MVAGVDVTADGIIDIPRADGIRKRLRAISSPLCCSFRVAARVRRRRRGEQVLHHGRWPMSFAKFLKEEVMVAADEYHLPVRL